MTAALIITAFVVLIGTVFIIVGAGRANKKHDAAAARDYKRLSDGTRKYQETKSGLGRATGWKR